MSVDPHGAGYPQGSQNQPGMPPMPPPADPMQGGPMPGPMPGSPLPASPMPGDIHMVRPERPGTLTAAAVLGFVTAAFEFLGGLLWILGGSVVGDLEDAFGTGTDFGTLIMLLGLASLLVGGVYIWGGVMALKCKTPVLFAACGVGLVINIVALVLSEAHNGWLSAVLAIVTLILLAVPASRRF